MRFLVNRKLLIFASVTLLAIACKPAETDSNASAANSSEGWTSSELNLTVDECKASAQASAPTADAKELERLCRCFVNDAADSYDFEHFSEYEAELVATFSRTGGFERCQR